VQGIETALGDPNATFVLVLGDRALRVHDAHDVEKWLGNTHCLGIGAPRACPYGVMRPWFEVARPDHLEGVFEILDPWAVRNRVDDFARRPVRRTVPPAELSCLGRAGRVLAGMDGWQVQEWTSALDVSRFALRRLCRSRTGQTPRQILAGLRLAEILALREDGRTDDAIAIEVGLSDGASVRRFVRARVERRRRGG